MLEEYNPFKMFGSWIGLVVGLISAGMQGGVYAPSTNIWTKFLQGFGGFIDNLNIMITTEPLSLIIYLGVGFLIGWGIHSLVRKIRD